MSEHPSPGENGRRRPDAAAAWAETIRVLPVGARITGEVVARRPFGVFLSIDGCPAAVGLAKVPRMPTCMELPAVGERVTGEVVWHDDGHRQVAVVLAEWAEHEALLPRFRPGQIVGGGIVTIRSVGTFVDLDDCFVQLLRFTEPVASAEVFRDGQEVSVRIVTVDREHNRILLVEPAAPEGRAGPVPPSLSRARHDPNGAA
ncbi:S1 RNA-binding domain-containing protein [Streptomyces sp. NBC_01351]|uniref:S1 RNA-binding domain-containing protein n=1 Tax=Streptomyces sp. NBC_01351 TaxID=2903833 RepID=UPI002E36916A|nr:S1 RNA-binding domain-containing protein [Streptomyces sp. NBC_01351]